MHPSRPVLALLFVLGISTTSSCFSVAPSRGERTAASSTPVATATNSVGEEIVVRTNAERAKLGLPTLARNAQLMNAAQLQANQMAAVNRMAHELPGTSYPSPASRLDAVGYKIGASGENIAEGYPSAAAVVAGWMTSPGHRDNIV